MVNTFVDEGENGVGTSNSKLTLRESSARDPTSEVFSTYKGLRMPLSLITSESTSPVLRLTSI